MTHTITFCHISIWAWSLLALNLTFDHSSSELLACVFGRQLQEEVDGLSDRLEQANNTLKGDWNRWQNSVRTDLKSAFLSASEKNIEYYEKVSPELQIGQI